MLGLALVLVRRLQLVSVSVSVRVVWHTMKQHCYIVGTEQIIQGVGMENPEM
jgi:hypothetical protein